MLHPSPPPEELPADELPADEERRGCVRYIFRHPPMLRFLVRPSFQSARGFLRDLSTEGAGLLVSQELRVGTVMFIQLRGFRRGTTRTQLARVVHCTQHGSGCWLVGCRWTCPLSADELRHALHEGGGIN
jgi:hypothetical protein